MNVRFDIVQFALCLQHLNLLHNVFDARSHASVCPEALPTLQAAKTGFHNVVTKKDTRSKVVQSIFEVALSIVGQCYQSILNIPCTVKHACCTQYGEPIRQGPHEATEEVFPVEDVDAKSTELP